LISKYISLQRVDIGNEKMGGGEKSLTWENGVFNKSRRCLNYGGGLKKWSTLKGVKKTEGSSGGGGEG